MALRETTSTRSKSSSKTPVEKLGRANVYCFLSPRTVPRGLGQVRGDPSWATSTHYTTELSRQCRDGHGRRWIRGSVPLGVPERRVPWRSGQLLKSLKPNLAVCSIGKVQSSCLADGTPKQVSESPRLGLNLVKVLSVV